MSDHYRARGGIVMGNFMREHDNTPQDKVWPFFDGSFVENHYNFVGQKENDRE